MAWFILARLLFVAAVAYTALSAAADRSRSRSSTSCSGSRWPSCRSASSGRCAHTPVTNMLGAVLGGAIGLLLAKGIGAALFWVDPADQRVAFLHSFVLLLFPYLGLVVGGRKGEWLEPARLVTLFRAAGPAAALQDPRHLGDHRRPHRRPVRHRLHGRHAGHSAVRAQGAAAGRRLGRLDEAQPRPARPRHPAEGPEDVGRRSHDLGRRLSRGPRGRPQADRAGAHAVRARSSPTTSISTRSRSCAASTCSTSTSSPTRSSRSCCRARS